MVSAGIDTVKYTPHSLHAASTSAAKRGGATIQQIMDAAGWSTATFDKFYDKEIALVDYNVAVLKNKTIHP